ncbi:MAG: 16S rRNA (cytosine(1402)-N(4))-methyltransferase RsmH [bacterium]|nr:16S rRNA (cytosine(1402)-N(4))-methyltransferase RsmH [bacterium]
MEYQHTPVMLNEIIKYLDPKPGENFIDCTLGGGGYTMAIAKRILPTGKILAIDLDEAAIKNTQFQISNSQFLNIILAHDNFKNIQKIVEKYFSPAGGFDGIVFDLGLSRAQLKDRTRGFSFGLADAPLGMNFGGQAGESAENIVNSRSADDLAGIFREYGEEKFAYKIAIAIVKQRQIKKIQTAGELVKIIMDAVPRKLQPARIHPATKVFQALRIAVNRELENLRSALPQALALLKPGGRLAVISYHSLEDRIVKQYFKQESRDCLCPPAIPICQCGHLAQLKIINKGILRPTEEEALNNPSSRSAKLRLAVKIHPVK